MTTERQPCPKCGTGLLPGYVKRHQGSKFCARMADRLKYTRPMFGLKHELEVLADKILKLAEGM